VGGQRAWLETAYAEHTHAGLDNELLLLVLVHALEKLRRHSSGAWVLDCTSISVDLKPSVEMPVNLV